jgi:uncharacterized protein involved in exopolysaccharide biosynthesis
MEELTIHDYLTILRRQKKYFLLAFFVLFLSSFFFALCWSNYRSSATVEIEQPEVATDARTPIGMNQNDDSEAPADLRIGKIEQKVTAPASLIEIISKYNLYPHLRTLLPMANVADRMREMIRLNLVSSTVANPAAAQKVSADQLSAIAFNLSFDYGNPQTAQQVTNELVSRFLDEDLKERRSEAEATSAFLATQITALEASMAEQEKNIAAFEEAHGVSRPESLMFNQQAAETTTLGLQNLDSQIASNEGTQGSLRGQLATVDPYSRVIANGQVLTTPETQLKALQAQYSTLSAQYGPDHPDLVKLRHQIAALRQETGGGEKPDTAQLKAQIEDTRTNLDAAEKTDGMENPDVIALQHKLSSLEEQLAAAGSEQSHTELKKDADNPAYLELEAQLKSAEEQHKALLAQRESLEKQQVKYQEAVTQNPGLAQQMAVLSRDYDNAQLRYRELKEKKMAADMDVQLVQDREGQRLFVIVPPDLPLKTHPSRLLLILSGLFLSLLGGLGAAIGMQVINQSIVGSPHLTALVGVPPLVSIPHIYTYNETSRIHRLKPYIVCGSIFLFIAMMIAFNFAVMPLDVVWSVFTQRLGLS